MGTYYRVYAEAKVQNKWVNFNPYIVDLDGKVKLAPLIGFERSTFYEAHTELEDYMTGRGFPNDMCTELNDYLEPDKEIDWWGKPQIKRDVYRSMAFTVKYSIAVKKRIVEKKPTKYEGYVEKHTKAAHQIGEIQEIHEWLDERQYRELTPKVQKKYSYYEWDDDLSWYASFKTIERHIESMKYWFAYNAETKDSSLDDVIVSDSDIRLIVIAD